MLSRNERGTSGAALRSEKRSLKVWEPYALLLRQEENSFALLVHCLVVVFSSVHEPPVSVWGQPDSALWTTAG